MTKDTEALREALEQAYEKVKEWPERNGDPMEVGGQGFMDLLALRNLIPDALAALATPASDVADPDFREYVRKAGERLAPHSGDAPGTPTRDALVWINAALHPVARASVPLDCPIAPNVPASDVAPVAYRYVHLDYAGRKVSRYGVSPERVNGHDPIEVHPLYAHPPAHPVDPAGGEALREVAAKYADMGIDERAEAMADNCDGDPWELIGYFREKLRQSQARVDAANNAATGFAKKLAALKGPAPMTNPIDIEAATIERCAVANQIIGQIEERFPDWRSYRDLIDCIDVTLHSLKAENERLSKHVTSGVLPGLLDEDEKDALLDFVKHLRNLKGQTS